MTIRKALTFRASAIGDALTAKYMLENVHAAYPDARCAIVVASRGAMIRDLLAAYPWIEVIQVNRRDVRELWKFWKEFHGSDLVVTPPSKPTGRFALPSKIVARLLAKRGALIGFKDRDAWTGSMYDHVLEPDPKSSTRLLEQKVLAAARIPIMIEDMRMTYLPQPHLLQRLSLEGKKYLVVHLFAGSENRAMSTEKRQSLVDALAKELPDVPMMFTGTKSERPLIETLSLPPSARIIAGELSVQELAALIDGSTLVVSIGTGPSHMTSNLGKPLLVLVLCLGLPRVGREEFGDAAAARIFCDSDACRDGHDMQAPFPLCIEGIDVQDVASAAKAYFA